MQSTLIRSEFPRLHVAIIMDGNGRWAAARRRPRTAGHRAGAQAVRRTVEAALPLGLGTLTLYAFSSDNWKRPRSEVETLMRLLRNYLREQTAKCVENGIRLSVIGRRDRLPAAVVAAIEAAERTTAEGRRLHLRLAVDYSARAAILGAALRLREQASREEIEALEKRDDVANGVFSRLIQREIGDTASAPEVDLLIRTGGEQRLSDFLLWECAYAEMIFTTKMWPDFQASDLETAIQDFQHRERRFGGLPGVAAG